MRCELIISLFLLSLAYGAPPKSQNGIIAHFLDYAEALRAVEIHNGLLLSTNFVRDLANSVPVEHRGPGTAALQEYVSRSKKILKQGTSDEKAGQGYALQTLFENLKDSLDPTSKEAEAILPGFLGILALASEFAEEDEKVHTRFGEGARQMLPHLTPNTLARESELVHLMDTYIKSEDLQEHENLYKKILAFRNRY
ncbi:uncharacterized protein LOC108092754 [Drosophila ficusphila]|uniref:uncharacterized protein LOC108092754 n=1 Tax=Drosophila ficusphila TaxID=30025 RepID=UPI0007E7C7CA|nr:uncharacterized protein LOC108092754 [Drosophila ficusphila]